MSVVYVDVELYHPRTGESGPAAKFLVDSGATYSVVPASVLRAMGIDPVRRQRFALADGTVVELGVGVVGFRYNGQEMPSPVIFSEANDVYLLGAVTLETFGLVLDPFNRELRPGPMILAKA